MTLAPTTYPPPDLAPLVRQAFAPAADLRSAQIWTWTLARSHYENFPVLSHLLPKHLRQDFANVYAFCRVADDLADEVKNPACAAAALARFKEDTHAGHPEQTLFLALSDTIRRHELPLEPFLDLIDAFEQDQRITRYDTFEQLMGYCRRSADPVGRLVLYMCGYRDEARQKLSDKICSALQLTNFWQDVRRDIIERDRIYLPRESMDRFAVTEAQIKAGRCDANFRQLIQFEVDRTAAMFDEGEQLLPMLRPEVRRHIALFSRGGRAILKAIRARDYDTLTARPSLSRWQKGTLVLGALARHAFSLAGVGAGS